MKAGSGWAIANGALGAALGYSLVLMSVAAVRELLGFGTLCGWDTGIASIPGWRPWTIMIIAPGAFFVLALIVWAARAHDLRRQARKEAAQ